MKKNSKKMLTTPDYLGYSVSLDWNGFENAFTLHMKLFVKAAHVSGRRLAHKTLENCI